MPHTYSENLVHCVFSSKERVSLIPTYRLEPLWAYLFGIAKNEGLNLIAAGGITNHIHLTIHNGGPISAVPTGLRGFLALFPNAEALG